MNSKELKKTVKKTMKEVAYTAKNVAWNEIHNLGESILPTLKDTTRFKEGILTPNQFVEAGDELIHKCLAWGWVGCKESDEGFKCFLPLDKQYLIIRSVPCEKRAKESEYTEKDDLSETEDGWNTFEHKKGTFKDIKTERSTKDIEKSLEYDMVNLQLEQEFEGFEELQQDEYAVQTNIIPCRRYDICITYDNYYRVPRVWLSGYNEYGVPLNNHEIEEDIMSEYVNRTVTLERFPYDKFTGLRVSIHPCKHAETMKTFIKMSGIESREYMFTFLKFIQSILPTINYDFTGNILMKNRIH